MKYKLTIERLHQKNPEEGAIQGLYKTEYKQHFQKKIRLRKMNSAFYCKKKRKERNTQFTQKTNNGMQIKFIVGCFVNTLYVNEFLQYYLHC